MRTNVFVWTEYDGRDAVDIGDESAVLALLKDRVDRDWLIEHIARLNLTEEPICDKKTEELLQIEFDSCCVTQFLEDYSSHDHDICWGNEADLEFYKRRWA